MKLLFVNLHSSRIGKANLDVFNSAIELAKRGYDVHVIGRDDLGSLSEIPVHLEGIWVYPIAFRSALHSFFFLPLFFVRVFRIATQISPDVIVTENNLHCPFVGYWVAKSQKRPLLFLLRELTADALYYDKSRNILKRGLAWLMMKASHFLLVRAEYEVAINSGIADYYTQTLGKKIPSIWLMASDLSQFDHDKAIFQQVADKYGLQQDRIKLLYTGTLTPERGLETTFQALSQLPNFEKFQLLITGEGKALGALKDEARKLGILQQVSFLGWLSVEELNALLLLVDMGIEPYCRPWPQDHTPSSKVALYVAAGLFVIATDAPGYQEVIVNGENGYLYKDAEQLRIFLQRCADEPHLLSVLKQKSQMHRNRVNITSAVDALEVIIQQVSSREGKP